jgi:hypothetical protein
MARGEDTDNIILGLTQRQREKKARCNNKLLAQTKIQYKLLQRKRIVKIQQWQSCITTDYDGGNKK